MSDGEMEFQEQNETENTIRPLIISDRATVNQYCASFRHLLFGFEAQDVRAAIVVPPKSEIEPLLFPGARIIEHPILRFPLFYAHNKKSLFERIEEVRPGVIHCFGTAKALLAKSVAEYLDVPAVITLNSTKISRLSRMLIDRCFEKIIVPSAKISLELEKFFPKEKITQVNLGTFTDEVCSCFSAPARLPSMITLCRFNKFKTVEPMLNAIRHLAVDGYDFVVIFMGQGRAEKQIREFINQTGLSQTVILSPPVRPLRAVFRGCDILIHTNYSGSFDPVIIEAAGAGLAVAADKNNVEELLHENSTAIFFDRTDELSIYSALQKMLDDKQQTCQLAMNLQEQLRKDNSVSTMVGKLMKIYASVQRPLLVPNLL
jgi:glycosyltransferase involved in cell wall biosynthesis